MAHIVLLGDSVFDNGAYVAGGPEVLVQLREIVPQGWQASLNARDGAGVRDVQAQLDRIPNDATHLVVSAGGNDALGEAAFLEERAGSVAEVMAKLADVREQFGALYHSMLDRVLNRKLPTAVCTIYDPRFPDAHLRRIATAALTVFNDVIAREAFARHVVVVDLRVVCANDEDFANPIEPSVQGGEKIARAVVEFARGSVPHRGIIRS
jgi:hypothetical protein